MNQLYRSWQWRLLREVSMNDWLRRSEKPLLFACAVGAVAVIGWICHSTWSSRQLTHQVSLLMAERDEALKKHQRLQQSAGELKQLEAKLGSARLEYGRAVEGWAEARAKLAAAQQEFAGLAKRLDQMKDRVSVTGTIRQQPEPPRGAGRRP
jgi:hypothetical protein